MSENMRLFIWMVILVVDIYMYLDWGYNNITHRKEKKHDRRKRNQRNNG